MRFGTLVAAAASIATLGAGAAGAATYSMSATCLSSCSDAGLAVGDMLTGRLRSDSSTFAPNGTFGDTALQSFNISFGATVISSDDVVAAHLNGQWGATRRDVPLYDLVGGTTVQPTIGATFLLSGTSGFVSNNGSCDDANCSSIVRKHRDARAGRPGSDPVAVAGPAAGRRAGGARRTGISRRTNPNRLDRLTECAAAAMNSTGRPTSSSCSRTAGAGARSPRCETCA